MDLCDYESDTLECLGNVIRNDIESNRLNLKNKIIGYQGVKGSFSEEVLIKYFGENMNTLNYEKFEDVFIALKNDQIDYGILPLENSSTGAISSVYDLLRKYEMYIVAEERLKINQNLVGIKGAKLEDIKEVYSHPQGFEQSKKFLSQNKDLKLVYYYNTAISAKHIKEIDDKSKAAICSLRAAEIYNLDIIKKEINDNNDNSTKFIIVSKNIELAENSNKITVVFSLDNQAGTLYNLIGYLAKNHINMMKIESRPSSNEAWNYVLYVDFEGNINDSNVNNALKMISKESQYFRLLGCYKNKDL